MDPWINLLFNEFRKYHPPILYGHYSFQKLKVTIGNFCLNEILFFDISLNEIVLKTACSTKGSRDKTTFLINKPRSRDPIQYHFPNERLQNFQSDWECFGHFKVVHPMEKT